MQIVAGGRHSASLLLRAVICVLLPELLSLLEMEGDAAGVVDACALGCACWCWTSWTRCCRPFEGGSASKGGDTVGYTRPACRHMYASDNAVQAGALRHAIHWRAGTTTPDVVRPLELGMSYLSVPRAVGIPTGVRHMYATMQGRVKLRRAKAAVKKRKGPAPRLTLKQSAPEGCRRQAAKFAVQQGEVHPLFTSLKAAIAAVEPKSALVFLCRSSGLTVYRAAELSELGLPAVPLPRGHWFGARRP